MKPIRRWKKLAIACVLTVAAGMLASEVSYTAAPLEQRQPLGSGAKFSLPAEGKRITVAFVLADGATMIDFAGPWEVFQDVRLNSDPNSHSPFEFYTVATAKSVVRTSGGMSVTPQYSFDDAPAARIVVIPNMHAGDDVHKVEEWIRRMRKQSDLVMSVCLGVDYLLDAGLLDGKKYTTNHLFYDKFEKAYPKSTLVRSQRWVQSDEVVYTAGGLTSGIDLALHVVELYYGRDVAINTARYMEYESPRWAKTH